MNQDNQRITTAGICFKENKVLIGKRIDKGAIASKWEFPGGKNRWGESVEGTLKREFLEELGIEVEVGELLASCEFDNKGTHYFLKAHQVFIKDDIENVDLSVHTEVKWELLDNLKDYNFAQSDQQIIKQLIKNFERV